VPDLEAWQVSFLSENIFEHEGLERIVKPVGRPREIVESVLTFGFSGILKTTERELELALGL
jgi:hypothetical protein